MKAEHRHELKTNALAKHLLTFPDYIREYGARFALGLAIGIMVIILIFQRINRSSTQAMEARGDLAYARDKIELLSNAQVDFLGTGVRPADVSGLPKLLRDIKEKTSDKHILAEVLVAQGDYAWAMANLPPPSGATTNPSLKPDKEPGEFLKDAQGAYQAALDQYGDLPMPVAAAHFGLAAVAEQNHDWDTAKKHYEAVKAMGPTADAFKPVAMRKLDRLAEIRQPILIGQVPDKFELPPTPATTQSTTGPTTAASQPTSKPVK
jgi:hypothetical protein